MKCEKRHWEEDDSDGGKGDNRFRVHRGAPGLAIIREHCDI